MSYGDCFQVVFQDHAWLLSLYDVLWCLGTFAFHTHDHQYCCKLPKQGHWHRVPVCVHQEIWPNRFQSLTMGSNDNDQLILHSHFASFRLLLLSLFVHLDEGLAQLTTVHQHHGGWHHQHLVMQLLVRLELTHQWFLEDPRLVYKMWIHPRWWHYSPLGDLIICWSPYHTWTAIVWYHSSAALLAMLLISWFLQWVYPIWVISIKHMALPIQCANPSHLTICLFCYGKTSGS